MKPKQQFASLASKPAIPALLGGDEDVRTLHAKRAEWAQEILRDLQTEDGQRILQNIKLLRQRFEPEALAREEASRARRAKAEKGVYRAREDDVPSLTPLRQ